MPTSPKSPLRRRRSSWTGTWLNHQTTSFKQAVSAVIQAQSPRSRFKSLSSDFSDVDRTLSLSDSLLLKILEKLPESQNEDVSLVCKRWLSVQGRRLRSMKVFDWEFLLSGRLVSRFPKLTSVDLVNACFNPSSNSGILLCHTSISFHVSTDSSLNLNFVEESLLDNEMVDKGLRVL